MTNYLLTIENENSYLNSVYLKIILRKFLDMSSDKFDAVVNIRKTLGSTFKIGCGGSHIWISNLNNERQAIIYFS